MADIIDIRDRLPRQEGEAERTDGGTIFRIRICGPERHEVEAAGRALGRAFILEGHYIAFEHPEGDPLPTFILRAGREVVTETGAGRPPGLLVAADGGALTTDLLGGCGEWSVLLAHGSLTPDGLKDRFGFPGTAVALPVTALETEPFGLAAACAGGAARLLGEIRWTSLEQGLREEFAGCDHAAVNRLLAMALEAYDRTAPWAGRVKAVPEEIDDTPVA